MKFIKPKYTNVKPVTFKLSERTRNIIKTYSEYTGHTENVILEEFLVNVLDDPDFVNWIQEKRNNIRLRKELGIYDG